MSWWKSSSVFLGGNSVPVAEGLSFFLACLHLLNVKGIEVWRSHSASCHPKPRCVLYIVQDIELCSQIPSKSKNELALNPLGWGMNDKSYKMTMTFNHLISIVQHSVSTGREVPLSLCPGTKKNLVPVSLCPKTRAGENVPGQIPLSRPGTKLFKKFQKKRPDFPF